ncbi:uncharacterized protein VTP21DRAFT_8378 [Calcarisporiella thermophila]|uniref:uncharacterized protein n=1 Tax=Calcarisporiella thermophila TaxID=911321 RepID=UPI0037435CB1
MGGSSSANIDFEEIKRFVEDAIASNFIVVFSKSYCPYCTRAKKILADTGKKAKVYELDQMENGQAIQEYLLQKTGQRTVPNIFIGQKHVGGCDDLTKAKSDGTLDKLLAADNSDA